ncbi:ABC transporter substrate-binding protein [Amycolatopsis cihanbeyliensis]|uniref:NitT/TauT family transport system substrate-binding protein n=1 Tax=Amycolatopsis cihanbeyliensis TaxID=1128664 RepID=A0A542DL22_AMYCI|nr:ABC transporter substrate-binding protein [Amycolatopsis cihanbeyliensis]TQJ03625.1 NitT/TauT family transport system substrate-binding protein [Amycolatopsis cihanbeyliensis]
MRRFRLLLAFPLAAVLTGCGLLGGDEPEPGPAGSDLEKPSITVAVLPSMDTLPVFLAAERGYFAEEGLEVRTQLTRSGADAVTKLIGGDMDIAFSSYPAFLLPQARDVADLRLVAAVTELAPGNTAVVAGPGSPVRDAGDLAGKRVAITARNTLSHLLVAQAAAERGVDPGGIEWIELPFPDTPGALSRGEVDAAFLTEPFLTQATAEQEVRPIHDFASGSTEALPVGGFAATAEFAAANPRTVAAFRQALDRATEEAATNHGAVRPLLIEVGKVDPAIAGQVGWTSFTPALEPERIQRVADVMVEREALDAPLDVATMIG